MVLDIAARVIRNNRTSGDYNVLALAAPGIGKRTRPGQFVMVKGAPLQDSILRRPFSVFEVLRDAGRVVGISILNKRAGLNTRVLYDANPGDVVRCLGPLGRPFALDTAPDRAGEGWMVAGGVGLAPFATLAESLAAASVPMTLFYGARSARELFYLDLFRDLGARLVLATEDGSFGVAGRVTVPLEEALRALPGRNAATVYACGPEPMLEAVAKLAMRYGQSSQVSVERVMGCGLGGCYSCVVPVHDGGGRTHYVRSCIGGPVFSGSDLVWDHVEAHQ